MVKAKYLSDKDNAELKRMYTKVSKMPTPGLEYTQDEAQYSADVYFIKVPSAGIPARAGAALGSATGCQICRLNDSGSFEDISGYTDKVFNPYPVKWYGVSGVDIYAKITREKFGYWVIEKPKYRIKAKPNAAMTAGGAGVACSLFIAGTELASGEDLTAYLNWMHGGQNVSSGKEIIIEYFEDEQKWIVVESACE